MRSSLVRLSTFHNYVAGEQLLESERLAMMDMVVMSDEKDVKFWEIFKPEKDDFKGLSKGLAFLKFDPAEAEKLFNAIGTTVNIVGGIVSVVGAVGAVLDLMKELGILSSDADNTEAALQAIGVRVEQIYGYLAQQERRGLYSEALGWRVVATQTRNAVKDVAASRSPDNLRTLIDRASDLDNAILKMLDVGKGRIAFLRAVYGNAYWIDGAQTPFMKTAGGASINYSDRSQELQADIWDAGHYLDILVRALLDRLAVAVALEPAFRSTGYNRGNLDSIADALLGFVHTWRASILVADPVYCINPGGLMRSPYNSAPVGVPIGAVDPVTGISSFDPYWQGFTVMGKTPGGIPAPWDPRFSETWAQDPTAAVQAATAAQAAMVDQVIKACGIERMLVLQRRFREVASAPSGSNFVRLPDASFRQSRSDLRNVGILLRNVVDEGTPVTVDLGRLKVFSPNPDKTYEGKRYLRRMEKHFSFLMARRAEISKIRLGYRLRVGSESLTLSTFSTAPGDGVDFPSGTIEHEFELSEKVYDCYQSGHMTAAEEDRFERDGSTQRIERLFLNERDGHAKVRVTVEFQAFAAGDQSAYAGEAKVTIANLEPEAFPDASILSVMVFEEHVGMQDAPEEVIADSMTVHMIPSYVVLGNDFFQDFHAAQEHMVRTVKGINDKYSLQDMQVGPPDPDPAWRVRARAFEVERGLAFIDAVSERATDGVLEDIAGYLPPIVRG